MHRVNAELSGDAKAAKIVASLFKTREDHVALPVGGRHDHRRSRVSAVWYRCGAAFEVTLLPGARGKRNATDRRGGGCHAGAAIEVPGIKVFVPLGGGQ